MNQPMKPQVGRQPRRRRAKRLRETMVITVGTGEAVMEMQPFEIGPVNVVSYSPWQPQEQPAPESGTSPDDGADAA